MKRLVMPGLAILLGVTGCVESAVDPDAAVVVSGKALRENESPIADATLKLYRSGNSACVLMDHYRDVSTDTHGGFRIDMTGAETQTQNDIARCFQLRVPAEPKGATVHTDFLVQIEEMEVPELRLWNGAVAASEDGEGAKVTWKPLFDTHGVDGSATIAITQDSMPAWSADAEEGEIALSAYVLEDFANLEAQLITHREVNGSGTEFKIRYYSDVADLPAKQLVPASRGAKCTIAGKTYETGCPYTDGKLVPAGTESGPELVVTFDTPKKLTRAVLRGFAHNISAKVVIEGTVDGGNSWTQLGQLPEGGGESHEFVEVELAVSAPAVEQVRLSVQGQNEPKILRLSEVSYFE